jgi:hypothetical protein
MGWIRDFTQQQGDMPPSRNIEDAPQSMRQELIDVFFSLTEQNPHTVQQDRLHRVICQSLGVRVSANPYGGYRYATGRDIMTVDWPRVYDLISRLWPEFCEHGLGEQFRIAVNRVLAAYGVAWDLGEDGRLHRVLPGVGQTQVRAAFAELSETRYAPALALFNAARDAYDDRPRRDRDACANVFDAMESVARLKYNRPTETFGQIKNYLEQSNVFRPEVIAIFTALNQLRNQFFGHGAPFPLSAAEVDFTYLTCIGAILLFTRTP